ncbi:hypothetical protein [Streptomyces griseorubiginosus]|uniref:hypothetical protein n=1 Tax=Streptomyces griseorubiginosus TaxID=67304 RepID=UPI00366143BA
MLAVIHVVQAPQGVHVGVGDLEVDRSVRAHILGVRRLNRSGSAQARDGLAPVAGRLDDECLVHDLVARSDELVAAVRSTLDGEPFLPHSFPSC